LGIFKNKNESVYWHLIRSLTLTPSLVSKVTIHVGYQHHNVIYKQPVVLFNILTALNDCMKCSFARYATNCRPTL